jgi:xylulose-5-phosphate/fructose-6-phosphate phosphoketolase
MAVLNEITEVSTLPQQALSFVELQKMDAYWRACNYLCAGMIYLREIPFWENPFALSNLRTCCLGIGVPTRDNINGGRRASRTGRTPLSQH